ncbi:hypothetical protein D3C72_1766400 [compost metagenome]
MQAQAAAHGGLPIAARVVLEDVTQALAPLCALDDVGQVLVIIRALGTEPQRVHPALVAATEQPESGE